MGRFRLALALLLLWPALAAQGQELSGSWALKISEPGGCSWTGSVDIVAPDNPGLFTGSATLVASGGGGCFDLSGSVEGGIAGTSIDLIVPVGDPGGIKLLGTLVSRGISGSWESLSGASTGSWSASCSSCPIQVPALPPLGLALLAALLVVVSARHWRRSRH